MLSQILLEEPTEQVIMLLSEGPLAAELSGSGLDLLHGLDHLTPAEQVEAIAVEYCRLFIGPGQNMPLHESIAKQEGRYWGDTTVAVNKAYQAAGFEVGDQATEMPDHIGIELEFLAHLCEREANAIETGDRTAAERAREARQRFASEHLVGWLTTLAADVERRADLAYYKQAVAMARDWVAADAAGEEESETSDS